MFSGLDVGTNSHKSEAMCLQLKVKQVYFSKLTKEKEKKKNDSVLLFF